MLVRVKQFTRAEQGESLEITPDVRFFKIFGMVPIKCVFFSWMLLRFGVSVAKQMELVWKRLNRYITSS